MKNRFRGRDSLKRGAWQERESGVFDGALIPVCTLCIKREYIFRDSLVLRKALTKYFLIIADNTLT